MRVQYTAFEVVQSWIFSYYKRSNFGKLVLMLFRMREKVLT